MREYMKISAQQLANKLNANKVGAGWMACCPAHDDTNPSLSINTKGDGSFLVKCMTGCSQDKVFKALRDLGAIGNQKTVLRDGFIDPNWKILWDNSIPVESDDCAGKYIKLRGLNTKRKFKSLRYSKKTRYNDGKRTQYLPALICLIKDVNGMPIGIQRIYLSKDGKKADFKDPKRLWGSLNEGSVHLGKSTNILSVTEGVETALAIYQALKQPVWAALTSNNLKKLRVPDTVEEVHIWADKDKSQTGEIAAKELADRLVSEGKRVQTHTPLIETSSESKNIDWLDILVENGVEPIKEEFTDNKINQPIIKDAWPDPETFSNSKLPNLPVDALPPEFRNFIVEKSQQLDISTDILYMHVLGMLSLACARVFKIRLKPGWEQPGNLYLLTPMISGQKKSQAVKEIFSPVYEWEKKMADSMRDEIKEAKIKVASQQALINGLRSRLGKKSSDDSSLKAEIETAEKQQEQVPVLPVLIATDITAERTISLLKEQKQRIAFVDAEGGLFDTIAGRYSNSNPNWDIYLKSYENEFTRTLRQGTKEELFLDSPAITFSISPQPIVVQELSKMRGANEKGFMARFLYCYPEARITHAWDTLLINPKTQDSYNRKVKCLLSFSDTQLKQDPFNPILLMLSEEATEVFVEFHNFVQNELKPKGKLAAMREWGSKFVGTVGRIALLFHVAKHVEDDIANRKVSSKTVKNAVAIGHALLEHAIFAYNEMRIDNLTSNSIAVTDWIKADQLPELTRRKCQMKFRSKFKKSDDLSEVLEELSSRHIIRRKTSQTKTGGRPSEIYSVNPKLFTA